MNYIEHMALNFYVAFKCFLLGFMHFLHGVVPCKYTSHDYYSSKKDNKGE